MGIGIIGQIDALHAGLILFIGQYLLRRNEARAQDILLVVDIVQKGVQRFDPLTNTAIDLFPLSAGNDARDAIEWNQTLGTFIFPIHIKRDADAVKKQLRLLFLLPDRELIGVVKPLPPGVIVVTLLSLRGKHLIIIMPVRKRYFYHGRLLRLYSRWGNPAKR